MPRELRIFGPDRFERRAPGARIKLKARVSDGGVPLNNVPVYFKSLRPDLVEFGTAPDPSDIGRSHGDGTVEMWVTLATSSAGRSFQIQAEISTGVGGETDTVWYSVSVNP